MTANPTPQIINRRLGGRCVPRDMRGEYAAATEGAHSHLDDSVKGALACDEQARRYPEIVPNDGIRWRLSQSFRPQRRVVFGKRTTSHHYQRVVEGTAVAHQIVRERSQYDPPIAMTRVQPDEPLTDWQHTCCKPRKCVTCGKQRGMDRLHSECAPCREKRRMAR